MSLCPMPRIAEGAIQSGIDAYRRGVGHLRRHSQKDASGKKIFWKPKMRSLQVAGSKRYGPAREWSLSTAE